MTPIEIAIIIGCAILGAIIGNHIENVRKKSRARGGEGRAERSHAEHEAAKRAIELDKGEQK